MADEMDLSEFYDTRGCPLIKYLETLDDARFDKVVAAMQQPWDRNESRFISHSAIAEVVEGWTGERVSADAIGKHRRKACSCE